MGMGVFKRPRIFGESRSFYPYQDSKSDFARAKSEFSERSSLRVLISESNHPGNLQEGW